MNRIVGIAMIAILVAAPIAGAGAQSSHAADAELWIRWPWHFPCLRIFGCYPPELPPLTPPSGPNVPGPHCGENKPC